MTRPPLPAPRAGLGVHLALVCVQLFFASMSPVAKVALRTVPPVGLVAFRSTATAAIFAIVWVLWFRGKVARGDVARAALYALFGVIANQLLFIGGLSRTTATNALVIGSSIPVFTVGVALAMKREQATGTKLCGLGLAFAGALTLTGASRFEVGTHAFLGNAMIMVNSLSYAVYLVISRDMLARVSPMTMMMLTFGFGAIGVDLFMFAAAAAGQLSFDPMAFIAHLPALDGATWARLVYIVLFPTVGAYLLNAVALRVVPASLVAIYIYMQPVVGTTMAALDPQLRERPTKIALVAAALIFSGIWLATSETRRRSRAARA